MTHGVHGLSALQTPMEPHVSRSLWGPCGPALQLCSHLLGVVVEDADAAQQGSDGAALRVARPAVPVGSLSELISDDEVPDGGRARPDHHLSEETRVQHEAHHRHDQTDQKDQDQDEDHKVRHDST